MSLTDKSSFRDRDGQDFSSVRPHLPYGPNLTSANPGRVALTYWTRSAAQRNVDALVKVGDYHYYGIGMEVDPANETTADRQSRLEKAANYYQSASETQASALAMWNLGWMHENGMGVAQVRGHPTVGMPQSHMFSIKDFHLAKRYYDLALETNSEAYFPIILSLLKLHIRSIWHALTRGSQREKTILLWNEASDEGWYLGKSKAEMRKKQHGKAEAANGGVDEEDIISWSKRKQEGTSEEADFGPEDYFDAATNRRRDRIEGMDDDDLSDTMVCCAGMPYFHLLISSSFSSRYLLSSSR
jgi:SEL1 protein